MTIQEIRENIKISFESMRMNKLRSFLASLGVMIGISFVILMGWVLSGLDRAMMETFEIIGSDMLYVDKWDWAGNKNWRDIENRKDVTFEQADELKASLETAEMAIIQLRNWGAEIKYDNQTYEGISIIGTEADQAITASSDILHGRFFNEFEDYQGSDVIVVGFKIFETVFNSENPVGKEIKVDGHKYLVIGVLKKKGTMMMDFIDNQCYIPFRSYVGMYGKNGRSVSIAIKAYDIEGLGYLRDEVRANMRIIRNLKPWEEEDFSINEMKVFEDTIETLRLYVWGIGIGLTVLSFIVGIIGIMNIMFVSVTERTKEIGIRKAIGAKKSSILIQFLSEASSLSLFGAFISLIGCSLFVLLVATILPKFIPETSFLSPYLPYELLFIASLVSIFVGMLAGFIPAYRAANLDPVDALRYE